MSDFYITFFYYGYIYKVYRRSDVRHVFPGKIVGAPLKEDPKIVKKMWAVWHGFVCKKGARDSPFS